MDSMGYVADFILEARNRMVFEAMGQKKVGVQWPHEATWMLVSRTLAYENDILQEKLGVQLPIPEFSLGSQHIVYAHWNCDDYKILMSFYARNAEPDSGSIGFRISDAAGEDRLVGNITSTAYPSVHLWARQNLRREDDLSKSDRAIEVFNELFPHLKDLRVPHMHLQLPEMLNMVAAELFYLNEPGDSERAKLIRSCMEEMRSTGRLG